MLLESPKDWFAYLELFVRYDANFGKYFCMENILGLYIGTFRLDEGAGWVLLGIPGTTPLMSGTLHSLAAFQDELNETLREENSV